MWSLWLTLLIVFGPVGGLAVSQVPPPDRMLDAHGPAYPSPGEEVTPDTARFLVGTIFRMSGVLFGFEESTGPFVPGRRIPEGVELHGRTVREACDLLVRMDPRYEWRQVGQVIVIRPRGAWEDPTNVLNKSVVGFHQHDADLPTLLVSAQRLLSPSAAGGPILAREEKFSVSVARGSVLDVLNAIALSHGSLMWQVRPRGSGHTPGIWLMPRDGKSVMFGPIGRAAQQ